MINIALVGYGYWGPNVAKNIYANKEYELKVICDKKQDRLEKAKKLYAESVKYIDNFEEILEDDTISAVALAVETSAHYELAKKALLAGKDVYVEKPFTETVEQALNLNQVAKERNLIIHVDHIMVYHPVIKKIKSLIDEGDIGDIIYFDCSRINLGQLKNDVSAMWDLSVHDLSIIDFLSDGIEPVEVKAIGKKAYSQKESVTFLSLNYEKFLANITASWLSPIKERRILIAGTKKMLVYDDVDVLNKLIVYDKGFDMIDEIEYADYVTKTRSGDGVIPKLEQSDALYNSLEQFRQSIIDRKESKTNAEAAIRILRILEKANEDLEETKCSL